MESQSSAENASLLIVVNEKVVRAPLNGTSELRLRLFNSIAHLSHIVLST